MSDVMPYIQEAVNNGQWKTTGVIQGRRGVVIGDKLELVTTVKGYNIWVGGYKEHSTGKIYK